MDAQKPILVGAIAGAFGVKGDIRLKSFTSTPDNIKKYSPLFDEVGNTFTIKRISPINGGFSAWIDEIKSREQAESFKGTKLFIERSKFEPPADEEYYHNDLFGLNVIDSSGNTIGKIKAVQNYGAGDLLEIQLKSSTELLPFTTQFVPSIDIKNRKIFINTPKDWKI